MKWVNKLKSLNTTISALEIIKCDENILLIVLTDPYHDLNRVNFDGDIICVFYMFFFLVWLEKKIVWCRKSHCPHTLLVRLSMIDSNRFEWFSVARKLEKLTFFFDWIIYFFVFGFVLINSLYLVRCVRLDRQEKWYTLNLV